MRTTEQRKTKKLDPVKSAARVLDIFELLRDAGRPLTLTTISQELDIPKSSLHALMLTLTDRRYLEKDKVSQRYRLGPALITLAGHTQEVADLIDVAETDLDDLSQESGESISLAVLEGQEVVFVHKKASSHVVRVVHPVGTRLPAHATALGKCLLAFLSPEDFIGRYPTEQLPALTGNTITSRSELARVLQDIRTSRIAYDREESRLDVFAVASPVFDSYDRAVASVSIGVPVSRASHESVQRWENLVLTYAERVSARLGHREARSGPPESPLGAR